MYIILFQFIPENVLLAEKYYFLFSFETFLDTCVSELIIICPCDIYFYFTYIS